MGQAASDDEARITIISARWCGARLRPLCWMRKLIGSAAHGVTNEAKPVVIPGRSRYERRRNDREQEVRNLIFRSCGARPSGLWPLSSATAGESSIEGAGQPTSSVGRPGNNDLLGFPDIHWQKIRANNPLERIMKKSGAEPAWSAPSGRSVLLHLAAARSRHIAERRGRPNAT